MQTDVPAFAMTIGGKSVATDSLIDVINPATEAVFAYAPNASQYHIDTAVAAARGALADWRSAGIDARRAVLCDMAAAIEANASHLAAILTQEQGKPIKAARDEIVRSAAWLRDVAALTLPQHINEDSAQRLSITQRVPIGVVGAIVPWNYPVLLAAWKIAPALLSGNSIIVKPSPFTPCSMLAIGALVRDIAPPGVFNVISGDDALGPMMTAHPGIDKIAFTGSTATGRRVMASGAATLKRLTLELGGNDAAIVLPDCDPAAILPALFAAAFGNSGQICIATKRLYVHVSLFDRIVDGMAAIAAIARIGNGMLPDTAFGPIQNKPQYDRVLDLLNDSQAQRHSIISATTKRPATGYFVPFTIIVDPPDDSRVVREEAFGPILPIMRYTDIDDAVRRINATPFGLGASVWSNDLPAARAIADRIEAGTVWINETRHVSIHAALAGHKQSGIGAEHGHDGLMEYSLPQTVSINRRGV